MAETYAERDWNYLVRGALLLGMSGLLVKLLLTGQITSYIHPKFTWFTIVAVVGLVAMALAQFGTAFQQMGRASRPLRGRLYSAVLGVVCAGIFIRPHVFGADLASKQGLNLATGAGRTAAVVPTQPSATSPIPASGSKLGTSGTGTDLPTAPVAEVAPAVEPNPAAEAPASGPAEPPAPAKEESVPQVDRLVVTSYEFAPTMQVIYYDPTPFVGKRIVLEGFTFHPPGAQDDTFAVTRLVVTCHVAHAAPDGLLAYSPGVQRPAPDTWHQVEGVLEAYEFMGTSTVRIRIERITAIPQPADPYVYP